MVKTSSNLMHVKARVVGLRTLCPNIIMPIILFQHSHKTPPLFPIKCLYGSTAEGSHMILEYVRPVVSSLSGLVEEVIKDRTPYIFGHLCSEKETPMSGTQTLVQT